MLNVVVWPIGVTTSDYDAALEDLPGVPAVRLRLRLINGLKAASAQRVMAAGTAALFYGAKDLSRLAGLDPRD